MRLTQEKYSVQALCEEYSTRDTFRPHVTQESMRSRQGLDDRILQFLYLTGGVEIHKIFLFYWEGMITLIVIRAQMPGTSDTVLSYQHIHNTS